MRKDFTTEEKLAAVEQWIEMLRPFRSQPETREYGDREMLKAIARDLRAQRPESALRAVTLIEQRVESAQKQGEAWGGYPPSALERIGSEVMKQWPVLRRALEAMGGGG